MLEDSDPVSTQHTLNEEKPTQHPDAERAQIAQSARKTKDREKPKQSGLPDQPSDPNKLNPSTHTKPEAEPAQAKPEEPEVEEISTLVQAETAVSNYALASALVGMIPLPLVDLAALTGLQLTMLHSLCRLYEVEFSRELGRSLIASLIGAGVTVSLSANLSRLVRSLVKSVPFYGAATGMISVSLFGSASTYAIGKVFIKHFESGGAFLDFDPERVREYYATKFQEAQAHLRKSNTPKVS